MRERAREKMKSAAIGQEHKCNFTSRKKTNSKPGCGGGGGARGGGGGPPIGGDGGGGGRGACGRTVLVTVTSTSDFGCG